MSSAGRTAPAGWCGCRAGLDITWQDDNTLKAEFDAGTQMRILRFGAPAGPGGDWQGVSVG